MRQSPFSKFLLVIALCIPLVVHAGGRAMDLISKVPNKVGNFACWDKKNYDDSRLGASVSCRDQTGTLITMYLYDLGVSDIKDGTVSPIVKQAYSMAKDDIYEYERRGAYRSVKLLDEKTNSLRKLSGGSLPLLSSHYFYVFDQDGARKAGEAAESFLFVTGFQQHILKFRVTGAAKQVNEKQLLQTLQKLLNTLEVPDKRVI